MAVVPYDYLDQNVVATALIQSYDDDSFYNPVLNNHTGFAADGTRYTNGVQDVGPILASWYRESIPAPITAASITTNVLTVTCANAFYFGQSILLSGTAEDFLNGQTVVVQTSSPTQFTAAFTHANFNTPVDTGTAQGINPYRDDQAIFPAFGLILLSQVALTIVDESTPVPHANELKLWMQFIMSDPFMLTDNFNGAIQGFTPSGLAYADGIVSVIYTPDPGNQSGGTPPAAQSHMVVNIDFTQDKAYLDVALQ